MEQIETWTQKRLEEMIANGAEESIHLDFKAAGALGKEDGKKREICKDVSAFANSDGGIIIYGINEANHKADSFSYIDGDAFTKEWLEQTITDGIQRRIDGIRIHPVRFDGDIKKTIYVVEIPVSYLAPHMAKDNRFYKRFDFKSVIMEEYEVRNTYGRKQKVKLSLGDILLTVLNEETWMEDEKVEFLLSFYVINEGETMAENYKLRCWVQDNHNCQISWSRDEGINYVSAPENISIIASTKTVPIYPRDIINALEFTITISVNKIFEVFETFPIQTILFMDNDTKIEDFDLSKRLEGMYEILIGRIKDM